MVVIFVEIRGELFCSERKGKQIDLKVSNFLCILSGVAVRFS